MEDSVFKLITQILMEDRINEILRQNKEYQSAKQEEDKLYDILMSDLNDEQKNNLHNFIDGTTWIATLREKYAYQQGMKDLLSFFKALSEN